MNKLEEGRAYPGVSPEEAIGQGKADVKVDCFQDAHLHLNELAPVVSVIADVQEVIDARWASFLYGKTRSTDVLI